MKIKISQLNEDEIRARGIRSWPIWNCDISEFDWEYKTEEICYLIEGNVEVSSKYETVKLSAGDFVVFPRGLKCHWKVTIPVRKHYSFS